MWNLERDRETAIKIVLSPFPPLDRGYNRTELLAAFNDSAKLEHPWNFYRATFSSNLPTIHQSRENSSILVFRAKNNITQ